MTKYNGIFDSHAHYDDDKFNSDRDELIPDLFQNGVRAVINAASDMKSSAFAVSLSQKYPQSKYNSEFRVASYVDRGLYLK